MDTTWSEGGYENVMDLYQPGGSTFWWAEYGYPLETYQNAGDVGTFIGKLQHLQRFGYRETTKTTSLHVQILPGGHSALVLSTGVSDVVYPLTRKKKRIPYRATRIFVKEDLGWRLLHEHFSPLGKPEE